MKPAKRSIDSGEPMPVGRGRARDSGSRSSPGSSRPTTEQSPLTLVAIAEPRLPSDSRQPERTGLDLLAAGLTSRRSPHSSVSPDLQQIARRLPHSGQQSASVVWTQWSLLPHSTIEGAPGFLAMQAQREPRPIRRGNVPSGYLAFTGLGSDLSSVEPYWHSEWAPNSQWTRPTPLEPLCPVPPPASR